jgi:hypothetical protein
MAVARVLLLLVAAIALVLTVSVSAGASNATLRTTLNSWSKKIGVDAHSVALAAQQRHPRRMTSDASRFRKDALQARAAVVGQQPSTDIGSQARRLALAAFADYTLAGTKWASSGRARLAHKRAASITYANAGSNYARRGNKLLIAAGKMLC